MKKVQEKLNGLRSWALGSPWVVALLLLPFFKPQDLFERYAVLLWAMVAWKGAAMLLIAVCFLAKPRISPVTVLIGVYRVLLVVSTMLDHDFHYSGWLFDSASIAALCVLMDQAADADPKALVKGFVFSLGPLCLVNLATVLLFPGGMRYMKDSALYAGSSNFYFLGLDNSHAFFIVPLLAPALLYVRSVRQPFLWQAAVLALLTVSIYITWAVSGVVAASAFIALFILYRVKQSWRLCNVCTYYGVIAVIFLLVVWLRMTDWLAPVIVNVLHKDVSFSNRLPLWEMVISYIKAKPLLGYGMHTYAEMLAMSDAVNWHNLFLQTLYETGIAGMAVYAAVLALLVRPLMRTRSSFGGYMLAAGLFAFLLILQVEALVWPLPFYALVLLCYYAEKVTAALEPASETS